VSSLPHPVVGVGGVLIQGGQVLLIKRGKEPLAGRWVVPGGTVELGESLEEALIREVEEETALRIRPLEILTVFDRIERRGTDTLYHYVIIDYLCAYVAGTPRAGSDARAVAMVAQAELDDYDLPPKAREVVEAAFRRASACPSIPSGITMGSEIHGGKA